MTSSRYWSVAVFFGSSFVMHLLWENAQMPLFETGEAAPWELFTMCLRATATGDMLFMVILFLTVAIIHKELWWTTDRAAYAHPATWIVPVLLGVLLAVSFELWAVYVVHRWKYSNMPLLPLVGVGLTPALQMIIVPSATTKLCWWMAARNFRPASSGISLAQRGKV